MWEEITLGGEKDEKVLSSASCFVRRDIIIDFIGDAESNGYNFFFFSVILS